MNEYAFTELGYFTEKQIEKIKQMMEGKSYMSWHITCSNCAGNCTLVVQTHDDAEPEEIRNFFLHCVLGSL